MKLSLSTLLIIPFGIFIASDSFAGSGSGSVQIYGNENISVGAGAWITTGEGGWETSFIFTDPGFGVATGRSKLQWENLDSVVFVLSGEVRASRLVSFAGRLGGGNINDGANTDSDWIDDFKFLESEAQTEGNTKFFTLDMLVDLRELFKLKKVDAQLEGFIGYHYYTDEVNDTDGVTTLVLGEPIYDPLDGLDSTYDFAWQMLRLGGRAIIPVYPKWTLSCEAALLALLDYEGQAYWNLRAGSGPDDFRESSPNFVQTADTGRGIDARCSLSYELHKSLTLSAGYWYMHFEAENGEDTIYFADGTAGNTSLDNVESTRHGAFLELVGRF